MELSINRRDYGDVSGEELRRLLDSVELDSHSEIWLSQVGGVALCCLKSRERCFLMCLQGEGDTGFTTRGEKAADDNELLDFRLSNGQVDEYPKSWTITYERGKEALEYFSNTGAMDPGLIWHED